MSEGPSPEEAARRLRETHPLTAEEIKQVVSLLRWADPVRSTQNWDHLEPEKPKLMPIGDAQTISDFKHNLRCLDEDYYCDRITGKQHFKKSREIKDKIVDMATDQVDTPSPKPSWSKRNEEALNLLHSLEK